MSLHVLVAGCGPAGMTAAIAAAREGAQVTVLEGMEKPGKKLLLTGNGRCNLTNLDPALPEKYRSACSFGTEKTDFLSAGVLRRFSTADTLDFFHALGLFTTERNGYVYPYTGQSSSVLELLLAEMKRLRVRLKFSEKIVKIEKNASTPKSGTGQWMVQTQTWNYRCDRLILCCGSRAAESTGSDGSGYLLAKQAGHTVFPALPALTALNTGKPRFLSACAGVRCPAQVVLYACADANPAAGREEWKFLAADRGELQFTEKGISGIVVFQVSRYASLALHRGKQVKAALDLRPDLSGQELERWLGQAAARCRDTDCSVASACSGLLPQKLLAAILEEQKIRQTGPMARLQPEQQKRLARSVKHFSLSVTGTRPFAQCQVCAGGVPLDEIDPETLESKKSAGLYFAGEILDVDGPCGGYNLQWAWSSGYTAGREAARSGTGNP